jgi:hypothetical protein
MLFWKVFSFFSHLYGVELSYGEIWFLRFEKNGFAFEFYPPSKPAFVAESRYQDAWKNQFFYFSSAIYMMSIILGLYDTGIALNKPGIADIDGEC